MAELYTGGSRVSSVFQLIGNLENDITKSIAWVLANCPVFLSDFINDVFGIQIDAAKVLIRYQHAEKGKGITDLEITDNELFYIIIEAKRGWNLPGADQLSLYSNRKDFSSSNVKHKAIVTMSECSGIYAASHLPFAQINNIPVIHIPWRRVYELADVSRRLSNNSQKLLLDELKEYLRGIMTMQRKESNWVYIVSLASSKPTDCSLTWIDIVNSKKKYFHPVGGNGWPKEPPNYIAFRYYGQLQSIHHIEDYVVTDNLHTEIPEMPDYVESTNFYVYTLGPAIVPANTVKTGKIYASGRKWAMFDTLFVCDTIADACNLSKNR